MTPECIKEITLDYNISIVFKKHNINNSLLIKSIKEHFEQYISTNFQTTKHQKKSALIEFNCCFMMARMQTRTKTKQHLVDRVNEIIESCYLKQEEVIYLEEDFVYDEYYLFPILDKYNINDKELTNDLSKQFDKCLIIYSKNSEITKRTFLITLCEQLSQALLETKDDSINVLANKIQDIINTFENTLEGTIEND
jgi:hypothetical protein